MASDRSVTDNGHDVENGDRWGHSGFLQFNDVSLDHLAPAEDRLELDLFDDDEDAVPEFATPLLAMEQDLVDKMRATIENAQNTASQRRNWEPESLTVLEHRLQAIVQSQEPTEEDARKRNDVLYQVNKLVTEGLRGWHGMHVAPYGSFVSGLYTSTGDLDISIEGNRILGDEVKPCAELEKEERVQLLKGLARKLNTAKPPMVGKMEYVMHARVPIIKLEHTSGIECDISVASGAARFKSTVLRYLADIDPRFSSLVRLVKLWAGAHGMNDAASGTFNSFALTLMVAFHLQTQEPPILPPLCELFQQSQDVLRGRPLHAGQQPQDGILQACGEVAWTRYHGYGRDNPSTATELLASFFVMYHKVLERWSREKSTGLRYVRISTWCGAWTYRPWSKPYCVGVEDPFDSTDNCARTIAAHASRPVVQAFEAAVEHMLCVNPTTVPRDNLLQSPQSLEQLLFTRPPAGEKKPGGRGRGGGRWGRGRGRGRGDRATDRPRYVPIPKTHPTEYEASLPPATAQAPQGLHSQGDVSDSPVLTQPPPPSRQRRSAGARPPYSDEGSAQQPFTHQGSARQAYSSQDATRQPSSSQASMQQPHFSQGSAQQLPPGLNFVRSHQLSMHTGASQHSSGELPRQHGGVQVLPARQPRQHQNLDHDIDLQTAGSSGWDHDLNSLNPNAGVSVQHEGSGAQHAQQPAQPRYEVSSRGRSAQHAQHVARPSFGQSSSGASAQHAQHTAVTGLFQRMDVGNHMPNSQHSSTSQRSYGNDYSPSYSADDHTRQSGRHRAGGSSFRVTDRPQLGLPSQSKRRPHEPHKQPSHQQGDHAFGSGRSREYMQPPEHVESSQADGWDASTPQGYYQQPQTDPHPHNEYNRASSTRDEVAGSTGAFGGAPHGEEHGGASFNSNQDCSGFGLSQRQGSTGLSARTSSGKVLTVPRPSPTGAQGSYPRADPHGLLGPPPPPPGSDHSPGAVAEQFPGTSQKNRTKRNRRPRGHGQGRQQQGHGQ